MKEFLLVVVSELRWRLALAAIVAIALACTEGAGLLLLLPLLHSIGLTVEPTNTNGLTTAVGWVFAAVGLRANLVTVLGVFLLVSVGHAVLYRANLLLNPSLEQQLGIALRSRLYTAVVRAEWSFFISRRATDVVHAVTTDIDRASGAAYQMLTLFTGLAVSAVYVAVAFRLSPVLTVLVAGVGVGLLWVLSRRTQRSSELGNQYAEADRRQFRQASESIAGLKVAKTLSAELRDTESFARRVDDRARAYLDLLRSIGRGKLGLDLASALLISTMLFIAVHWLDLRGAGLLVLVFVFARVMPRVVALQQTAHLTIAGLPSFVTVMRLIKESEAHAEHIDDAALRRLPHRGDVRLDEVSFVYSAAAERALHTVSLSMPAGRTTAIVGASGAGKSTLADILIGLLRPTSGRVLVDGQLLSDGDIGPWRRSIGYVPQDGFLQHDSIRANLLWAVPNATEAEMWDVLGRAAASDFIRARPEGLDTVVGDRGVRLSGGERQRLALARALLRAPDLLVLDEATSALDSINEQQILHAVQELRGRITTVIITHRLSAVRGADIIHVLDNGRLVESGTWVDLVARGGEFSKLLAAQGTSSAESHLCQHAN